MGVARVNISFSTVDIVHL